MSIDHIPHESALQKRQPSREENDRLLPDIHNSYLSANLRKNQTYGFANSLHGKVEFSWQEFWKTFIYETLPPVFFSPLAALFLEKDLQSAYHAVEHRALLCLSTKYRPAGSIFSFWAIFYPIMYAIHIALFLKIFDPNGLMQQVDLFQLLLGYLFLMVRNLIVSVKYGYLRPEDVKKLSGPPPEWDEDQTNRRLIFAGWRDPSQFEGLIEDEITCSMDENDVALQGMSFSIDEKVASKLRKRRTSELFTAATTYNTDKQITAGFVLHQILGRAYHQPFPKLYNRLIGLVPLCFVATLLLTRWKYDLPFFGEPGVERFATIVIYLSILFSFPLMAFGLISAHDFNRRNLAMKDLGRMIQAPGLPIKDFGRRDKLDAEAEDIDDQNTHLYIDLQEPDNVFSWYQSRRTLRSFGEPYYKRIQAYTSISLSYAIVCAITLNAIVWSELQHHISTIWFIGVAIVGLAIISFTSIAKAILLQSKSRQHRDFIKNQLILLEKRLYDEEDLMDDQTKRKLKHSSILLRELDEAIHFKEEIYEPTKVMGQPATQNVINSTLGILLAGLIFAIEGFSGMEIAYNASGWFLP